MTGFENLSDDELRMKLQEAGISCGPIMGTTRQLYINKLKKLAGQSPATPAFDEVDDDDEEASSPQRASPPRPKSAKVRASPVKPSPEQSGDSGEVTVRQRRPLHRKLDVKIEQEVEETGGSFIRFFSRFFLLIVICAIIYLIYAMYMSQSSRRQEIADNSA